MKRTGTIILAGVLVFIQLSCSETLQKRYDKRHGTTGSYDESDRYSSSTLSGDGAYRRDYSKVAEADARNGGSTDYNRTLVAQYAEMDKLGEVVLYELDILERRWNTLLDEYKSAKNSSREAISSELDRINDDQKTLYKAYTNIYRNGKTNWPAVKAEVEGTLRTVRLAK